MAGQFLEDAMERIAYAWKNPHIEEFRWRTTPHACIYPIRGESKFSAEHAKLSEGTRLCWICLFPMDMKKSNRETSISRDHVIPRSLDGDGSASNVRLAHRWCNSHRKSDPVTEELIHRCRNKMLSSHNRWLQEVVRVPPWLLQVKLRDNNEPFICPHGAD